MPVRAVSRRLRNVKRHFGIAAPRVVVRTQFPRRWLWFAAVLVAALVLVLLWLAVELVRSRAGGEEFERLRQAVVQQQDELSLLRSTAGTGQNAVSIERAAQQKLLLRVAALEQENSQLKEDLLLFERLVPAAGEDGAVRVESFRLQHEGDGRFRYRILLAYQGGRQLPEFKGRLQLTVAFTHAGKPQQLVLPEKAGDAEYQLELRNFRRREGGFKLPDGAVVTAAEVRVLQGDTLKAKKSAQL